MEAKALRTPQAVQTTSRCVKRMWYVINYFHGLCRVPTIVPGARLLFFLLHFMPICLHGLESRIVACAQLVVYCATTSAYRITETLSAPTCPSPCTYDTHCACAHQYSYLKATLTPLVRQGALSQEDADCMEQAIRDAGRAILEST